VAPKRNGRETIQKRQQSELITKSKDFEFVYNCTRGKIDISGRKSTKILTD